MALSVHLLGRVRGFQTAICVSEYRGNYLRCVPTYVFGTGRAEGRLSAHFQWVDLLNNNYKESLELIWQEGVNKPSLMTLPALQALRFALVLKGRD